ncbi:hypothetical protein L484_003621 [Morus notabilis]|uniref:Uncharacterized protein n=1 Tax=Morus notabilis TaxID=981085 RepID=W9R039_9ROSA|nr:hypothetical protein L484_001338 [Morus notabilis]EXC25886.1 hypothetical protein L484_003621 [Morus notabilis]
MAQESHDTISEPKKTGKNVGLQHEITINNYPPLPTKKSVISSNPPPHKNQYPQEENDTKHQETPSALRKKRLSFNLLRLMNNQTVWTLKTPPLEYGQKKARIRPNHPQTLASSNPKNLYHII